MEDIKQKLTSLLDEKFSTEEFSDFFLVDLQISKSAKVRVFVDRDHGGVTFDICRILSRHLEAYLDESLVLGEKYTLEVSSPGLERGLIKRQYPKNVGRKIKVKTLEGELIKGLLKNAGELGITIEVDISKKEKKDIDLKFEEIEKSIIIVSF